MKNKGQTFNEIAERQLVILLDKVERSFLKDSFNGAALLASDMHRLSNSALRKQLN